MLSSRKMHSQSNVLYKYVKIVTPVLDVIPINNFCIYMFGMTVSWNVINLSSVVTIYTKILRIWLDIVK